MTRYQNWGLGGTCLHRDYGATQTGVGLRDTVSGRKTVQVYAFASRGQPRSEISGRLALSIVASLLPGESGFGNERLVITLKPAIPLRRIIDTANAVRV